MNLNYADYAIYNKQMKLYQLHKIISVEVLEKQTAKKPKI